MHKHGSLVIEGQGEGLCHQSMVDQSEEKLCSVGATDAESSSMTAPTIVEEKINTKAASIHVAEEEERTIVDFEGPSDRACPRNWPASRKVNNPMILARQRLEG